MTTDQLDPFDLPLAETHSPRLEDKDWQWLERLTEALLAEEPGIATAGQFGVSGQKQFGVDTVGHLRDGGCIVASCKLAQELSASNLDKWTTAFTDHWETRWQAKGVRRFILVTTGLVADTKLAEAADKQRARCREIGVDYELWGKPQIIAKLRPHRGIVAQFVGGAWVEVLCGPAPREALPASADGGAFGSLATDQIAALQGLLSGEAEKRLERGLEDLRNGDFDAVDRAITDLRTDDFWFQLDSRAKARVLRLAASTALQKDEVERAQQLATDADALEPEEPRLAARIASKVDGAEAGLRVLGQPKTREGRQLRVALLLESGQFAAAADALAEIEQVDPDDPETERLRAWIHLIAGRRDAALASVERLEAQAPGWLATTRLGGVVRYACALSPALGPDWYLNASPVDLDLVLEDDRSQALLLDALSRFERLSARGENFPEQLWRIACVSNLRGRRDDAEALIQALLADRPEDPTLVGWALARRYSVDLQRSRELLEARYRDGEADQLTVRVLALLTADLSDAAAAARFLSEHLERQTGDAREEAEDWINRLGNRGGGLSVLIQEARSTTNWAKVEAEFEKIVKSDPPPFALSLAQLLASERRWSVLASNREAILAFGTAEAVRVVGFTLAATGSYQALSAFLEAHRIAFPNNDLPPDLKRLLVNKRRETGDLFGALQEARDLTQRTGAAADRHLMARIAVDLGDVRRASVTVRELLDDGGLEPAHALQWVELLRTHDIALARDLWRFAVSADADRQMAVPAFIQALSIGLESEAASLRSDFERAAAEGSPYVKAIDTAELQKILAAGAASAAGLNEMLASGKVPAHLYVEREDSGLDSLVLPSPDHGGPLTARLVRSGARPRRLHVGLPWRDWRLHMDVSALLIASELDLLDVVEAHSHPVVISSATPAALLDMERKAAIADLAALERLETILKAVDGKRLKVRAPLPSDRVICTPDNPEISGLDVGVFLTELHRVGLASKSGGAPQHADPEFIDAVSPGSSVWLTLAAAVQLTAQGAFEKVCDTFQVSIEAEAAEHVRTFVRDARDRGERAKWLARLRERIVRGAEQGRYVFIRRDAHRVASLSDDERGESGPVGTCLMDMLIAEEVAGAVSWFEDRNITGFPTNRQHPIVEVVDVLDALVADSVLSVDEAHERLIRFVGAGGAFVALDADDVVKPLVVAPVINGRQFETPALVAIRRSRAAQRRVDRLLKIGPTDDTDDARPEEAAALTSEMRLAGHCLAAVWANRSLSLDECRAKSEWIWSALRFERPLRQTPEEAPGESARVFEAMAIATACEAGSDLFGLPAQARRERQNAVSAWIDQAVLTPRLTGSPDIGERVAAHLIQLYAPYLDRGGRAWDTNFAKAYIKSRLAALPEEIFAVMAGDERFARLLGLPRAQVVSLRGRKFESNRFWRAVRTARRYGHAKVRTFDGRRSKLTRIENGVEFSGALRSRILDPVYKVLDREDENSIRDFVVTLDLPPDDAEATIKAALNAQSTAVRMQSLIDARERSVSFRYANLEREMRSGRSIKLDAFDPPPARLLSNYLRLKPGDTAFGERFEEAIRALCSDFSPEEALRRVGGVPVIGSAQFETTKSKVSLAKLTPVQSVRYGAAAMQNAANLQARSDIVRAVHDAVSASGEALLAILNRTARLFMKDDDWREMQTGDRLALVWAHSDRVLSAFLVAGADPIKVAEFFGQEYPRLTLEQSLRRSSLHEADAGSVLLLSREALVYHSVAATVGTRRLDDTLEAPARELLEASLTVAVGDERKPAAALAFRHFDRPDAMGTFLATIHPELQTLAAEPEQYRATQLANSLAALEADNLNGEAWATFGHLARTGLKRELRDRAAEVIRTLDEASIPFQWEGDLPLPRVIAKTIAIVFGPEGSEAILRLIERMADNAASQFQRLELGWYRGDHPARAAALELLELCGTYAGEGEDIFERLNLAVVATVTAWPEATVLFRDFVDQLVRQGSVVRALPLLETHLYLQARR